jgi:cytochrome P450
MDPENIRNPYAMYERLRKEDPVHVAQTGEHIVSAYSDVKSILKNPDFRSGNRLEWFKRGVSYFKNRDEDLGHIYQAINTFLLFLNPPDHGPIRTLVAKTWNNRDVNDIIRNAAKACLSSVHGDFDVVKQYAQPLPSTVISHVIGLPLDDYQYLRDLGVTMTRSLDLYHSWRDLVELNSASADFVKYFGDLVHRKRNHPDQALASRLITANDGERLVSDEQMISLLIFLFLAGEETTSHSISAALYNLIRHPNIYHQLRASDHDLAVVTDELFRFDSPVQLLGRIANVDTQVGDKLIPANGAVTLLIASANRDERQFEKASEILPGRNPNPHLSFGYGTHYCLGEWLGKIQTQIAIECFVKRFDSVTIPDQEIQWNNNLSIRGMKSLIISTKE